MYETFHKSFPFSPLPKTNPRKRKSCISLPWDGKEGKGTASFLLLFFLPILLESPPSLSSSFSPREVFTGKKGAFDKEIRPSRQNKRIWKGFFSFPRLPLFLTAASKMHRRKINSFFDLLTVKKFFVYTTVASPECTEIPPHLLSPYFFKKKLSSFTHKKKSAARIRKLYSTAKEERRGGVNK